MTHINALIDIVGPSHVLTGGEYEKYSRDWFKLYPFYPLGGGAPGKCASGVRDRKMGQFRKGRRGAYGRQYKSVRWEPTPKPRWCCR